MEPEPKAGASLELRELVKRYRSVVAVDHVSLTVQPGEFLTMLGPSGSGKTTTLNMIAGFTDLSHGEIGMDGRPIAELPPHRRNIGMVFQNYALFPHMTAFENVAFPLRQRRMRRPEIQKRVAEALQLVALQEAHDRYPRQLSGGQQQRVALARAIVFNPRLLLMDEPLGALDRKLREWLQLEIKRIHRQLGMTVIYVTHDQEEALVLSDRIAVFNRGRVEQVGTATRLYEEPRTLFVADFLGESNIFRGQAKPANGWTVVSDGTLELRARRTAGSVSGAAAVVVRPERMRVLGNGATIAADHNALRGTITDMAYLGSSRKVTIALDVGGTVSVRERAGAGCSAATGDAVHVAWSEQDGYVLPDRGERAPAEATADDLRHS